MSHFAVLVIGKNLEEQLAPYQENNMGDCPEEYLSFFDLEEKFLEEYEDGTHTMYHNTETKETLDPFDNECYREPTVEELERLGPLAGSFGTFDGTSYASKDWGDGKGYRPKIKYIPEGFEETEVPIRSIYTTFEEYVKDCHGYTERDPQKNRFGYWENPNAKWDWYQVGGRWSGFFKVKKDKDGNLEEHEVGNPGLMTAPAELGYADQLKWKYVDLESMENEAVVKATARYRKIMEVIGGSVSPEYKTWNRFIEENRKKEKEAEEKGETLNDIWSEARRSFWSQPENQKLREKGYFESADDFVITEEQYVEDAKDSCIQTFAVIKNGVWYEKGEMGWFGISTNDMSKEQWEQTFKNLIENIDPEETVTVVDCHI